MTDVSSFTAIDWQPMLPPVVLAVLGGVFLALVVWGVFKRARGALWRALPVTVALMVLAGPRAVIEQRHPINDVAVIVVDDSGSMGIAGRSQQADSAVVSVTDALRAQNIDGRVSHGGKTAPAASGGTHLMGAVAEAVSDVPRSRLAGVITVTDGEVHDAPNEGKSPLPAGVPFHALIVGHRHESDRRVSIEQAPAYGLVGQTVTITAKVDNPAETAGAALPLTVSIDGGAPETLSAPLGTAVTIPVTLHHAGQTLVDVAVPLLPGELTASNNRAAVVINGVRDRLKVLLVSGQPHSGERAWRALLKSDPNVDLIHFTILRPPSKDDGTPLNELALIPFPTKELFQDKLKDFDLVIFDRYSPSAIMPLNFFNNIVAYVQGGGAVMVAAGPEFADPGSLANTALSTILPAYPRGREDDGAFRPQLSDLGHRHPVTDDLVAPQGWGRWLRHTPVVQRRGHTVLATPSGNPLLILDSVEKGRVGLLLSDSLWLWAKGWDGGGPHAELVRRLSHWLMQEPELEEDALTLRADAGQLKIIRQSLTDLPPESLTATVTAPDQSQQTVSLHAASAGRAEATVPAPQPGVWKVEAAGKSAVTAVRSADPLEDRDLVATDSRLLPLATTTGGGVFWLEDGIPAIRAVSPGAATRGASWMGLRVNGDHAVTGVRSEPVIPVWLALALIVGGLVMAWWREGR